MKRIYTALAILLFIGAGFAYAYRGGLRDAWNEWTKPELPPAQEYRPATEEKLEASEEGTEAPEEQDREPQDPQAETGNDPLAWSGPLPAEVNLSVPFLIQAPHQNWVQPFEDACEEASLIMVDAFYDGRRSNFGADEGEEAILAVVEYENETYGHNKDTNTQEVALTAQNYYGYHTALIRSVTSADDIKAALANGYPVIVPAYGKALGNPNFRNGGPNYHMLVVKGYTKNGTWITNDPGTRRGADYLYAEDVLMNAIHSFHEENMRLGAKEMIVVIPNS